MSSYRILPYLLSLASISAVLPKPEPALGVPACPWSNPPTELRKIVVIWDLVSCLAVTASSPVTWAPPDWNFVGLEVDALLGELWPPCWLAFTAFCALGGWTLFVDFNIFGVIFFSKLNLG